MPWPQPDAAWTGRAAFLAALGQAEAKAKRIAYRGLSLCRICGQRNGYEALQLSNWEWPAGFRHYIAYHHVRPDPDFAAFIVAASTGGG